MRKIIPLPPSINSYYSQNRAGYRFKTNEARNWENEVGYILLNHKKFGQKQVILCIEYYFKNNRSDISNRNKILEDILQKMNIVDNDNQIMEEHIYKYIDKDNPRCIFELSETP